MDAIPTKEYARPIFQNITDVRVYLSCTIQIVADIVRRIVLTHPSIISRYMILPLTTARYVLLLAFRAYY